MFFFLMSMKCDKNVLHERKAKELTSVCKSLLSKVSRPWKLVIQVSMLSSKNSGRSCVIIELFYISDESVYKLLKQRLT